MIKCRALILLDGKRAWVVLTGAGPSQCCRVGEGPRSSLTAILPKPESGKLLPLRLFCLANPRIAL